MSASPEQSLIQDSAIFTLQCLPSVCRGLYHRVAQKVGCDPSYVSRVARGQRTSKVVSEALRMEIRLACEKANNANGVKGASDPTP